MTITAPDDCSAADFSNRFDNYKRRVLGDLVLAYICVLEWQANGRPHFHLLVAVADDIRTGFDFEHYRAVVAWNKARREGSKPKGSLNRSPALKALHERLSESAPAYRIGRQELVPIRTNQEAIARYVGGYLSKSLNHRQEEGKRVRLVRYSGKSEAWRQYKGAFSWVTIGSWLWRHKLKGWALSHGCVDMRAVAALFGPRWAYHHRDSIEAFPVTEWPTYAHWCASQGPTLPAGITSEDFPLTQDSVPVRRESSAQVVARVEMEESMEAFRLFLASRSVTNKPVHPTTDGDQVGNYTEDDQDTGEFSAHALASGVNSRSSATAVEWSEGKESRAEQQVPPEAKELRGLAGGSPCSSISVGDSNSREKRQYEIGTKTLIPRLHYQRRLQL